MDDDRDKTDYYAQPRPRAGAGISRSLGALGTAAVAVAIAALACGRMIEAKTVIEARVEPCKKFCASRFSECADKPLAPTGKYKSEAHCNEVCSTLEGGMYNWRHDPETGVDLCAASLSASFECIGSLSCEDTYLHWHNDGRLAADRPCAPQTKEASRCKSEHDPAGGAQ